MIVVAVVGKTPAGSTAKTLIMAVFSKKKGKIFSSRINSCVKETKT
jgi:hypothetical protein